MEQQNLFEAIRQRDEAIARVEANADLGWANEARHAVKRCMLLGTFTTDDVWASMHERYHTHERRALGAVMKRLQREGAIRPTGEWQASARPECHGRPIRVWRAA